MPVRFVDRRAYLGRLNPQLDSATGLLQGTHVQPAGRTGVIGTQLQPAVGSVVGGFTLSANRTGQIITTLDGGGGALVGTNLQPAGSGALRNGQTFSIAGSGFGVNPTPAPLLFETFESTAIGAQPGAPWSFDTSGSPGTAFRPHIVADSSFGGTRSCYVGLGDKVGGSENIMLISGLALSRIYLSYRARVLVNATGSSVQMKFARFTGNSPAHPYTASPQVANIHWLQGGNGDYVEVYGLETPGGGDDYFGATPVKNGTTWNRFELFSELAAAGQAVGNRWAALNDQRNWSQSTKGTFSGAAPDNAFAGKSGGNRVTLGSGSDSSTIYQVMMPFYVTNGSGANVDLWLKEIYIHTTQQRVEIGNNINYYACTRRSPQPLFSWTDTLIRGTANQADMQIGEDAFAHVIAANGAIVNSQSIGKWS
jgi:hypothetical protein